MEVYESVGKSVIMVYKKDQKGQEMKPYGCEKKSRKRCGFVIYSNSKVSAFRIVIRDIKF